MKPIEYTREPITPLPEVTYLEGEDAWRSWDFFMRMFYAQRETGVKP